MGFQPEAVFEEPQHELLPCATVVGIGRSGPDTGFVVGDAVYAPVAGDPADGVVPDRRRGCRRRPRPDPVREPLPRSRGERIEIGRRHAERCFGLDLELGDAEVATISRRHVAVQLDGVTLYVEDLGSWNGSILRGRTGDVALAEGQRVTFAPRAVLALPSGITIERSGRAPDRDLSWVLAASGRVAGRSSCHSPEEEVVTAAVRVSAATHVGSVRSRNEDAFGLTGVSAVQAAKNTIEVLLRERPFVAVPTASGVTHAEIEPVRRSSRPSSITLQWTRPRSCGDRGGTPVSG